MLFLALRYEPIGIGRRHVSIEEVQPPTLLPLLSRGRHGSPHNGACFMELASMLAGERWSDRPACTHPLLAAVARHVNDYTSDDGRQRLAVLIPSVIGLISDDLRIDARIALRCATAALPVVPAERQRVMANAVLTAGLVLADLHGEPRAAVETHIAQALAGVLAVARRARRLTDEVSVTQDAFRRHHAPKIVTDAIKGIAQGCVPDPDSILHGLLKGAIDDCRVQAGQDSQAPPSTPMETMTLRATTPAERLLRHGPSTYERWEGLPDVTCPLTQTLR